MKTSGMRRVGEDEERAMRGRRLEIRRILRRMKRGGMRRLRMRRGSEG